MSHPARKHRTMVTAPAAKKFRKESLRHVDAEQIADLVVGAVEKKLAKLPKQERIAERDRLISFLRSDKARRQLHAITRHRRR